MANYKDLTGKVSGKLTVVKFDSWQVQPSGQKKAKWFCQCECGGTIVAHSSNLNGKHTISCGCVKKQIFVKHREKVASGEWKPEKLNGKVFGRLTIKSFKEWDYTDEGGRESIWNSVCSCGKDHVVKRKNLADYSSCGCWKSEKLSELQTKHGMTESPTYKSWQKMKERVLADHYKEKTYYQDRNISICQEWIDSFDVFLSDMGERPEGKTLDRIDSNGNYSKENCRWSDLTIQAYNKRKVKSNTSGRTGVYSQKNGNWFAAISHYRKFIVLVRNVSFEDACKAREDAELYYYGFTKE